MGSGRRDIGSAPAGPRRRQRAALSARRSAIIAKRPTRIAAATPVPDPISARTMPRPDELQRRRPGADPTAAPDGRPTTAPSKTRRKREMHALQDLGEALVALDAGGSPSSPPRSGLPERLVDAIAAGARHHAHGARASASCSTSAS